MPETSGPREHLCRNYERGNRDDRTDLVAGWRVGNADCGRNRFLRRPQLRRRQKRVDELEAEVARQKDEISGYKREVESHFDKTASLVASMAGSYGGLVRTPVLRL